MAVGRGNQTLTAVQGVRVGHATAPEGDTGLTVVLGPFRAAAELSGLATGSRQMDALRPEHLVGEVDAVLLTGGSAFGLAAADGVAGWLAERGRGFQVGAHNVPVVPSAVIFDLAEGRRRPGPDMGRAACEAASAAPVPTGRVGAGAGAAVGKICGREWAMPGGLGSFALSVGEWTVGALAVVNALGDVLDPDGRIVAGARTADGGFLDTSRRLRAGPLSPAMTSGARVGENTTLCVVATDAPLVRIDLYRLARMAMSALPRRISPVGTPFDGDVVFALGPAPTGAAVSGGELLSLGVAARDALEEAITSAVLPEA